MNAVTLSQLEKAHNALQRSVAIWDRVAKQDDKDLTDTTRSGVVQNFDVAYEQSWKILRRWMMHYLGVTDTEITQRRQLYRLAAKFGLINDV
jgi:Nucleotidyltransferase substrate binding protein like